MKGEIRTQNERNIVSEKRGHEHLNVQPLQAEEKHKRNRARAHP